MTALTPAASSPAVRKRMQAQATRDTRPELALRRELHALGLRFRVHRRFAWGRVRRTVDVVFPREQVAVEVHGCFWHGCDRCARTSATGAGGLGSKWWSDKIRANKRRDASTARRLRADGWAVVTVWEHEDPASAARRVLRVVEGRRA